MSRAEIAQAILRHFTEHREACDSIEGIKNWWIASDTSNFSEQEIQAVLDDLCREGMLKKKEILSSQPLYALKMQIQ